MFAWSGDKVDKETSHAVPNSGRLGTFASCSFRYASPPFFVFLESPYPKIHQFRRCDVIGNLPKRTSTEKCVGVPYRTGCDVRPEYPAGSAVVVNQKSVKVGNL